MAAQEPSIEPSRNFLVSYFRTFVSSHRLIRITGTEIIKHTINLAEQTVDVWCYITYEVVLAAIKETGKVVCFFYLIVMMSIGTHSIMLLGCGWESGKFYPIVMMPIAKHYFVLASGSTRRLVGLARASDSNSLITVYFVCI